MRLTLLLLAPLTIVAVACGSTTTANVASSSVSTHLTTTAASAAPRSVSAGTFTVSEIVNASTYTPKGAAGRPGGPTGEPAAGDVWAFSSILQRAGKQAGTDHVTITFGAAGSALIDTVETLTGGSIVSHGTAPFQPTLAVPVVSGTGSYAGASGTITIDSKDNTHNDLTIALK